MTLTADFERVELETADPMSISRGTQSVADVGIVTIEDENGRVGVGAGSPSSYYGETIDTVEALMPDLLSVVEDFDSPHQLQRAAQQLQDVVNDNPAARAAVSIALHDLAAKQFDVPLYEYWGLDPTETVTTSFTIGIDPTERMHEKAAKAVSEGYPTLKVKLGTDRDVEIVEAIRDAAPAATIRVDANEAWTPREAVEKTQALAAYDVEFVEQPVPASNPEGMAFVREHSPLPIAADESCVRLADVPQVAEIADIAVLKLMKCGGLREAKQMIHAAHAHGLEVMLGCMLESNASIAAGAHLAPLLDYADIDGALLLAEDRYEGVPMPEGAVALTALDQPGTGAR